MLLSAQLSSLEPQCDSQLSTPFSNLFGVDSIRGRCDRVRQGSAWAYCKGKGVGGAQAGGRFGGGGAATTGKGAAARTEIWLFGSNRLGVESTRSRIDSKYIVMNSS